ncbi:hypothetical protein QYS39_05745 [Klebsiella pneumoniae]|nr:hypothetical protein [Klebsiella pneumoniae]
MDKYRKKFNKKETKKNLCNELENNNLVVKKSDKAAADKKIKIIIIGASIAMC